MKSVYQSRRGHSLISVLLAVIIIGILSAMTMPAIRGLKNLASDREAIGRAAAINQAQQAYKWRVSSAASLWTAALTDDAKFQLIRDYLPLKDTFTTLAAFEPGGYTYTMGVSLDTQVSISGPNGAIAY